MEGRIKKVVFFNEGTPEEWGQAANLSILAISRLADELYAWEIAYNRGMANAAIPKAKLDLFSACSALLKCKDVKEYLFILKEIDRIQTEEFHERLTRGQNVPHDDYPS